MIHTKLLIRRLAYVPWLLAFGLVLGWAGEAQAQAKTIKLSADKDRDPRGWRCSHYQGDGQDVCRPLTIRR